MPLVFTYGNDVELITTFSTWTEVRRSGPQDTWLPTHKNKVITRKKIQEDRKYFRDDVDGISSSIFEIFG